MRFLDTVEQKAQLDIHQYKKPQKEYTFLRDELETALDFDAVEQT